MHQGPAGEGGWPGPDRPCICRTAAWTCEPGHLGGSMTAGFAGLNEAGHPGLRAGLDHSRTAGFDASADARRWAAAGRPERRPGPRARPAHRLEPLVGRAQRRARVGLALVGPERHRPLGLGGDRQRRVHAEVGGDRRAVGDVQARVAVDAAGRGRSRRSPVESPIAQPPMKCAVSGRLNGSPIEPPGGAAHDPAISRTAVVAGRDPGGVRDAVALRGGQVAPAGERHPLGDGGDRVVEALHDQRDDGALGPVLAGRRGRARCAARCHISRSQVRQRGAGRRRR